MVFVDYFLKEIHRLFVVKVLFRLVFRWSCIYECMVVEGCLLCNILYMKAFSSVYNLAWYIVF